MKKCDIPIIVLGGKRKTATKFSDRDEVFRAPTDLDKGLYQSLHDVVIFDTRCEIILKAKSQCKFVLSFDSTK
jgi:hypothetical protein